MLKFGNKEFRNLQEQVEKNMTDIQDFLKGKNVLNEFGIKVVGQVESQEDLPAAEDYQGEYGDAYAVGDGAPYDLYIFTRPFEDGISENHWFNIGQFPKEGPAGLNGSIWMDGMGEPDPT